MANRIREAMTVPGLQKFLGGPGSSGVVEADETYWGNKRGYKRKSGAGHKMAIVALVERNGGVRGFHVPTVTGKNIKQMLRGHVSPVAHLMTDESPLYKRAGRKFAQHSSVHHSSYEYVRGEVSTNTVEGYFSILKRGLIGTYHHVGEQHLQRYVTEFDFRYNNRSALGVEDHQRTNAVLRQIAGKRL